MSLCISLVSASSWLVYVSCCLEEDFPFFWSYYIPFVYCQIVICKVFLMVCSAKIIEWLMVGRYLNDHRMGKVAQSWPLGCKCTLTAHVELFGPQTSWSLSPGLVLISSPPRLYLCGDCLDPRAGPCTWPLWTSWGLHKPPFKACQGPSGWLPFPPAHQLHHTAWCQQQACWGCSQS